MTSLYIKVTLNKGFFIYEQHYIQVTTYNILGKNKFVGGQKYTMPETRMTFDIDEDLKLELQMIALQQHKTVKEILSSLIQEFVNENK